MLENFLLATYETNNKNINITPFETIQKEDNINFINNRLVDSIRKELSLNSFQFIADNIDLSIEEKILLAAENNAYIKNIDFDNLRVIINTKKLNSIKHINNHLRTVNKLLPDAGFYVGRLETNKERKYKMFDRFGRKSGMIIWRTDFIYNRIIPKFRPTRKVYTKLSKGKYQAISDAEALGRLVYCGFEIIDFKSIDGFTYFVAMKTKAPLTNINPTYSPLVKLQRVGRNGKIIGVYKMRTMHPYSEFIQDFVVKLYGYNEFGKPANDFRLTKWGKIFRKFWIDELPQILNFLKGELAIVGVRPLSSTRFNELPKQIQKERIKYKPGLIPPYVSLNMPDSKGNIEAEEVYFKDMQKHPVLTNIRYFFMGINNILTRKIQSA